MSAQVNQDLSRRPGGVLGAGFCNAPHPGNPPADFDGDDGDWVWCRRFKHGEDSPHRAFKFSIKEPDEWFTPVELDEHPDAPPF